MARWYSRAGTRELIQLSDSWADPVEWLVRWCSWTDLVESRELVGLLVSSYSWVGTSELIQYERLVSWYWRDDTVKRLFFLLISVLCFYNFFCKLGELILVSCYSRPTRELLLVRWYRWATRELIQTNGSPAWMSRQACSTHSNDDVINVINDDLIM
jgi:hypothetical protein